MSDRQATAPTDEPIWNFSSGLILDPLDYYHAKILTTIAVYYRYTQQDDAVALYNRAFELSKPALERTLTQKPPEIVVSQNGTYLTMQLAKQSLSSEINGFWVESSLLKMGVESLKELKKLKSLIKDADLIRKVEVEIKKYGSVIERLDLDLGKHSKRKSKSGRQHSYQSVNQNRLEKLWNAIIFIVLGVGTSLVSSAITHYSLQALNIDKNWGLIFFGTILVWLIWAIGQQFLLSIVGLLESLFKRDFRSNSVVRFVIAFLVFLGGGIPEIILGGWPVILSILFTSGIFIIIYSFVKRIMQPKLFRQRDK
jgi:hypothetical protein